MQMEISNGIVKDLDSIAQVGQLRRYFELPRAWGDFLGFVACR